MNKRHGGAYDRGSADSYYRRGRKPHYYVGDTYSSEIVTEERMTLEEINDLCRSIAEETLDPDTELEELELQKQYEFMQYADEAADLDAEYYGVA